MKTVVTLRFMTMLFYRIKCDVFILCADYVVNHLAVIVLCIMEIIFMKFCKSIYI